MNRAIEIWNSSILGRVLTAICLWFSGQWQRSRVVRASWPQGRADRRRNPVSFSALWDLIRGGLCCPVPQAGTGAPVPGGASFCA